LKDRVDAYLESTEKAYTLLVQWVEDFRSKYGEYEDAQPTILKIEEALALYKDTIGRSRVKIEVQRARDARKAQGSVLEYGLDYHLSKFVAALQKGLPSDVAAADTYIAEQTAVYNRLSEWLEDFKAKFSDYLNTEGAQTVKEVEEGLKLYRDVIMQSRAKYEIKKARAARASDGSVLEYGLDYHLSRFKEAV
jgi:cytochrome c peroxidase